MNIGHINGLLGNVKVKLESLHPANRQQIAEAQKKPSEHDPKRMRAAKSRLEKLYSKLTTGRSDATKVKATGAKR
jgi:hypothetical protein